MDDQGGSTPANDPAVRGQAAAILAEPGGWSQAKDERVAKLYADKYGTGTVALDAGLSIGDATPPKDNVSPADAEEHQRTEFIHGLLRTDWGADHEQNFASAGTVARTLFKGLEEPFREMGSRVRMEYGPKGEAAAVKFLAELAKLKIT